MVALTVFTSGTVISSTAVNNNFSALNNFMMVPAIAASNISAGNFVNIYIIAGITYAAPAIATSANTYANGFALTAVASGATGSFYFAGLNSAITVSSSNGAAMVYLSDVTAGSFTRIAPSTSGSIIQPLGIASPGVGVAFTLQTVVQL